MNNTFLRPLSVADSQDGLQMPILRSITSEITLSCQLVFISVSVSNKIVSCVESFLL